MARSTFTIQWEPVVGTNGPTTYQFRISNHYDFDPDGGPSAPYAFNGDGLATPFSVRPLADGAYYFQVRATDSGGHVGTASTTFTVKARLATTGVDSTPSLALGTVLLALGAGMLIARRRIAH